MSRIRIRNFGPIKEGLLEGDGWIDLKKVTVFIGNQGSGKSTVAKLISTLTWIEKALTRGDYDRRYFERKNKFKSQLKYHRLENYFSGYEDTFIEYEGYSYHIIYENGNLHVEHIDNQPYPLPQIMYVPAERNFIANVKKAKALNLTSDSLVEFVSEYNSALTEIKGTMALPISNADLEYNKTNDTVYIKGKDKSNSYKIKLSEASSGFQSLIPLYLVSLYLSNSVKRQSEASKETMTNEQRERFRKNIQFIMGNMDLTDEQKRIAISEEAKKFNKTAFVNIVEEPEQNLFPTSQHKMLNSLLEFNNVTEGNKLIMTTHSPYLINYLTLAVTAHQLKQRVKTEETKRKLESIVPLLSTIDVADLGIYELGDNGEIRKLHTIDGLPSDENYLNEMLGETNELFAQLLEIQQVL